jgi:hypothetical protein
MIECILGWDYYVPLNWFILVASGDIRVKIISKAFRPVDPGDYLVTEEDDCD